MTEFPKKGQKLFIESGDYHKFSHFAWGNINDQFYGYISGYKKSADLIIKNALKCKDILILDTCIFPACFLYRQYIELTLKDMYLSYSEENKEEKIEAIKRISHNLHSIWIKVKPLILKYFPDDNIDTLQAVEDYLIQFINEDSNSFSFRYPITKDLRLVHTKERRINIENLAKRMNELESFFSAVSTAIGVMKDFEDEMKRYYEADMQGYYDNYETDDMYNCYDDYNNEF
jgi:ribosomal protein S8